MEWKIKPIPEIDYPIIDAHAHPYFNRDCPLTGPKDFDQYQQEISGAGTSFFCGTCNIRNDGTMPDVVEKENEAVLQWREHFGKHFYPGVNIHPNYPEASIAAVKRFYDMGFRWVGEIAGYVQGYREYATPEMAKILDVVSELGMVLNLHPSTIDDLDRLLTRHPRLKIVIAHPGTPDCDANYTLAEKHPNAYFDLSGRGLSRWHMLRWGIDRIGVERFLFGTDYPILNPASFIAGLLYEPLTPAERKAILHDNFCRLTGFTTN